MDVTNVTYLHNYVEEIAAPLVLLSSSPGGDLPRSWGFS